MPVVTHMMHELDLKVLILLQMKQVRKKIRNDRFSWKLFLLSTFLYLNIVMSKILVRVAFIEPVNLFIKTSEEIFVIVCNYLFNHFMESNAATSTQKCLKSCLGKMTIYFLSHVLIMPPNTITGIWFAFIILYFFFPPLECNYFLFLFFRSFFSNLCEHEYLP